MSVIAFPKIGKFQGPPEKPISAVERINKRVEMMAGPDIEQFCEMFDVEQPPEKDLHKLAVTINRCVYEQNHNVCTSDAEADAVHSLGWETFEQMKATPAQTLDGVVHKICALVELLGDCTITTDDEYPALRAELIRLATVESAGGLP